MDFGGIECVNKYARLLSSNKSVYYYFTFLLPLDSNEPLAGFTFVDFQAWESCKCIKIIGCQLSYEGPEGCDPTAQFHGARHLEPFTPEFPKIEVRASLVEAAVYCVI